MGKLEQTLDLIELYKHYVGKREVPPSYDEWCALSIIASAVGNRVWYEKFEGRKLCPNLYVILIGPSGSGKGIAIDDATDFTSHIPIINSYRGKATGPFIVDHLGRAKREARGWQVKNANLFLITPELSLSVGDGPVAVDFVKMMTELFTGGEYFFQHGTRTTGNVVVFGHCVNWLGGSTEGWFVEALTRPAVEGGALGRMAVIKEDYTGERIPEPVRPADYEELKEHIQARIYNLLGIQGRFYMTDRAKTLQKQWYLERDEPSVESGLLPTWRRQDDLILKLAMVVSLASGRGELVISGKDWERGYELSYKAQQAVPYMVSLACATTETSGLEFVRAYIHKTGKVQRQALVKAASRKHILAAKVQEFVHQLEQEGAIEIEPGDRCTWYLWKKRVFHA